MEGIKIMLAHRGKYLRYDGYRVRIDEDIAELMQLLWDKGIGTVGCCQATCRHSCRACKTPWNDSSKWKDGPNCNKDIWVAFDTSDSLEKFLNIIAKFEMPIKKQDSFYMALIYALIMKSVFTFSSKII